MKWHGGGGGIRTHGGL